MSSCLLLQREGYSTYSSSSDYQGQATGGPTAAGHYNASSAMATGATTGELHTGGTYTEEKVVGVTEVPIVAEVEHHHQSHAAHASSAAAVEVCGQKTFTEVEDRPVVKERVERYVEHHPVEKQYVVETRFVGERAIASGAGVTVVGQDEYVVEAAQPGPKCPINTGRVMDEVIRGTTGGTGL